MLQKMLVEKSFRKLAKAGWRICLYGFALIMVTALAFIQCQVLREENTLLLLCTHIKNYLQKLCFMTMRPALVNK